MILKEDIDFINLCFDALYENDALLTRLPAKLPPFNPLKGGVPADMWAGEVDEEGWVKWKMLESTLTEEDVLAIEANYKIRFPSIFRAYLVARFHCFNQVSNGAFSISLPPMPCDVPLKSLFDILKWRVELDNRFIAIGDYDDFGILCFDTEQPLQDADCAVVWIDLEQIAENEGIPLFDSFKELMTEMFLNQTKRIIRQK